MNDYIKKKEYHQQKDKQNQEQLKVFRKDWEARRLGFIEEKEKHGYGDISIENFLKLSPPISDASTETASRFIKLQNDFRDLEEERKLLWAENLVVEEFNKKHAVIHIDQYYIFTNKYDHMFKCHDFSLESKASFRNQYENKLVKCFDGRERSKADIWLKSPLRREYDGIIFDPTTVGDVGEQYNLWKGFAKKPIQGDCSLYWDHVKNNICSGNEAYYQYVRKWLAYVIQFPDQIHTSLVLRGSQGVGKNSFVEPLGELFGQHFMPLSNISELLSNFNFHLKNAVLIFANEALWGGNKKELGRLKAMITDPYLLIEGKGKDAIKVKNFRHIIFSSNEDWPIHIDADDRRFLVLDVSNAHKEDHEYFGALKDQLEDRGYEALLYDLLNEDLAGFKPYILPANPSAFDIKMQSADSAHKYIYEALREGCFDIGNESPGEVWQNCYTNDVYKDYCFWCEINGERRIGNGFFGKALMKLIPSTKIIRPNENGKRPRKYQFPEDYQDARKEFCRAYKAEEDIWDD